MPQACVYCNSLPETLPHGWFTLNSAVVVAIQGLRLVHIITLMPILAILEIAMSAQAIGGTNGNKSAHKDWS